MQSPTKKTKLLYGGIAAAALLTIGLVASANASGYWGHPNSAQAGALACKPSGLSETDGKVSGACASFSIDAATGVLSDFTYNANGTVVKLIDSLTVSQLAGGSESVRRDYVLQKDDVRLMARDGPGLQVMARNGTTLKLVLPAEATITVHQAVDAWSPAGATVTYSAGASSVRLNLLLPPDATIAQDGQALTVTTVHGPVVFAPAGMGPGGPGFGGHGHGHGGPGPMGGGPRGHDGPEGRGGPPREGPDDGQ